jgi:hypothetical protein
LPDLLSEPVVDDDDNGDNSRDADKLSSAVPLLPMQQIFNPMDIRNTTRLRNVAIDHKRFAIYQFPMERQITLNFSNKHQIDTNWCE